MLINQIPKRRLGPDFLCLKWYYAEHPIFSMEAIFKHKQVACMRRKMVILFSHNSFRSRETQVFKICKLVK